MTRVKVFVNDVNTKIISTEVKREGDRGIDEARIEFPLCATVEVSDTIQIVQDSIERYIPPTQVCNAKSDIEVRARSASIPRTRDW